MSATAYINRIATAVPPHDVHQKFLDYVPGMLPNPRARQALRRMSGRSQIDHRYSVLEPSPDPDRLDTADMFTRGAFPDTGTRMALFERHAPDLAIESIDRLALTEDERPSHLIVTTCTGLHAPGIDLELIRRLGLDGAVERTVIGFMGCYAAINGLKLAHHIVRSDPHAIVLMVNVELCSLHLQETENLEELLSFMIFSDGCAATLVSADPVGAEIVGFDSAIIPDSHEQITWRVGQQGFDMLLSGAVPGTVGRGLPGVVDALQNKFRINQLSLWAVHPGGRSVLDAVEQSLGLAPEALVASREVLRRYGNMSSPTVMFAIKDVMEKTGTGEFGAAMAFGPGITAEMMLFRTTGGRRMTSVARRSGAAELMDTEAVSFEEFRECLRHLEIINRCTLAYRPTLAWLGRLLGKTERDRPVSILDVGFGHGDMLRQISAWARPRGIRVHLAGIDLNPWSARAAALATGPDMPIRYEVGNVFDLASDRADIVLSSLFAHHLPDADLVRFIRWMDARAEMGWFVNDLHRHVLPYHFIRVATRMLPANRMVRHDAPVSVARGFTKRDWIGLLDRSGIDPSRTTIQWSFPFRFAVGCVR